MANRKELKINIPEGIMQGKYANNVAVTHTREEFILDFMMVAPPTGVVHSRIILSPGHIKRVLHALQDNINKYEKKFGVIMAVQEPSVTITN